MRCLEQALRGSTAISAALRSAAGLAAALALGLSLAGCSASQVFERLPTELGGEPTGTPSSPTTPYVYPAVHDMPPPRSVPALTDEQQMDMEKELQATRRRQEDQEKAALEAEQKAEQPPTPPKKPDKPAKKKAAKKPINGDATGAATKP